MAKQIQILRTERANAPPALLPGELGVEMGTPTRLWVGVPSSLDASRRKLLIDASAVPPAGGVSVSDGDARWVNVSGDTMQGRLTLDAGLGFGGAVVLNVTDLSRHISLHTSGYGFSVSDSRLNYNVSAGGAHAFHTGTAERARLGSAGLTMLGNTHVTLAQPPTLDMHATTKAYVDAKIVTTGGDFLPLSGGTLTGDLAISKAWPTISFHVANDADDQGVQLLAYKHGKLRWNVQIVDGALESPNWNLGSNFAIHRYDMNGDYISPAVLHLSRQSGQMDLSGNLNVECGGGSPGRLWVRGDHVVGGTTYLYQHLTANAGATINGVQNTNGNIVATNGNYHGFLGSHHPGSSCVGMYNWNNVLYFTNSDGNGVVSGNPRAYLDGAGNFTMAGTTFRGYNGMYIYVDGGTTQFVQNSSMWRWEYAAGSGHMSYVRGHDNAVLFQVQPDGIAFATSAATVGWLGIQYRSYSSSWFGMGWNGFVNMYIDGTYIGDMATTGWVNGNFYTAGTCDGRYLSIWGGDVHGDLRTLGTFRAYRGAYFMTENLGDSFSLWGNSGGRVLQFSSDGWKLHWDPPSGGSLLFWSWDGRAMSWTDPSGNFHCRGELYKYDTSDERVKRDVVPYEHGLAELIQLEPVRYRFNGLGGSIDDDVEKIGLIAQRVREHLPECVFPTRGQPHNPFGPNPDDRLPDQLSFNDGPLIHAVINALKTINARLTALEQRFA